MVGVASRSGNLLYHENGNNMFTNGWAVFLNIMIVTRVAVTTHQNISAGNCFEPP